MRLLLTENDREKFGVILLLIVAGLLVLTRSAWSLLLAVPILIVVYLAVANKEQLIAWVERMTERFEVDGRISSDDSVNPDVVLVRRVLDIFVGSSISTGIPVSINLGDTTHTAIYAQSGGGKTTILYGILYDILSLYPPDRVNIAIGDPKSYSFTIFGKAPHLFCPIGRGGSETLLMLREIDAELEQREQLLAQIPDDRLCEGLRDYHRIAYELGLDLPPIPWLIVVIDEVQEVAANEEAEEILTRLAKKGRALGIRLILATQRPTTAGISHEIQSQLECKFVGYMGASQEYSVARVPPEIYTDMVSQPGRFMLRYKGEWDHVMVERIEVERLEAMLRKLSAGRSRLEWKEIDARYGVDGRTHLVGVGKSQTEKQRIIVDWMVGLGSDERPSADEFMARFNVSQATAYRQIATCWPLALARIKSSEVRGDGGED